MLKCEVQVAPSLRGAAAGPDGRTCPEGPHDPHQAGRFDPQHRRCAAVHFLLPSRRLHRIACCRIQGGRVACGQGCNRPDPHQFAHVRRGPSSNLPGHGHRRRIRQGGYGRALGRRDHVGDRHDQRRRASRIPRSRQYPARVDRLRPRGCAQGSRSRPKAAGRKTSQNS